MLWLVPVPVNRVLPPRLTIFVTSTPVTAFFQNTKFNKTYTLSLFKTLPSSNCSKNNLRKYFDGNLEWEICDEFRILKRLNWLREKIALQKYHRGTDLIVII